MVAGAGSGKTTSLIKALQYLLDNFGKKLRINGQRVACITYTELAAEEIATDLKNSPWVHVSTIHSFLWTIVRPFQPDICRWVLSNIERKISELREKASKPKTHKSTIAKCNLQIAKLESQLREARKRRLFVYSSGSDYAEGVLGHEDIIRMVPMLMIGSPLFRAVLAKSFPYILVDESQDTDAEVVRALKEIAKDPQCGGFVVGFFGDPMQKIYTAGFGDIPAEDGWEPITKPENFRCSVKVLAMINKIREPADGLVQTLARLEEDGGHPKPVEGAARIFVIPADDRRTERLDSLRRRLSQLDEDPAWLSNDVNDGVRILVLVHRTAANRLGFARLYEAMNDDAPDSFRMGFAEGESWVLRPFMSFLLPLLHAHREHRDFEVMNLLRASCPLLATGSATAANIPERLSDIHATICRISDMMQPPRIETIRDVLRVVHEKELFLLDERLVAALTPQDIPAGPADEDEELVIAATRRALDCPAHETWGYRTYIEDQTVFSTQQGIKGAEFARVLTIIDEDEGKKHFQFSYPKFLGLQNPSETDLANVAAHKETTLDRTRRLFYVCCSRALNSLAVAVFTTDVPGTVETLRGLSLVPTDDVNPFTE
jgi:DNA helicase-2/ATP-dependent DNA helicase PcrA